jgi:hypothetical protein
MTNMKWHIPKQGIKPHKEMRVRNLWVDLSNDKVNFERLNQGRLLYPMNIFSWNVLQIMKVK